MTGDKYSKEWVQGAWRAQNILYVESDLTKSEIYLETEPLFARGLVRLPNHPILIRELRLLERQAHRGGRESVDHPRSGHDDHANAGCGASRSVASYFSFDLQRMLQDGDEPTSESERNEMWRKQRLVNHMIRGAASSIMHRDGTINWRALPSGRFW